MKVVFRFFSVVFLFAAACLSSLVLAENERVSISPDGSGEVLIIPFYTSENGWDTYFNIYNPSASELLHIKLRSGKTGEVITTFSYYPDGYETFRASISENDAGHTILRIAEGACLIGGEAQLLRSGGVGAEFLIAESLGSAEVYSTNLVLPADFKALSCEARRALWANEEGGLVNFSYRNEAHIYADINLVNVNQGLSSTYSATALTGTAIDYRHEHPTNNTVDLRRVVGGLDAVEAALAVTSLENEIVNVSTINGNTEWVVSYVLDGYKNDKPYAQVIDGRTYACEVIRTFFDHTVDFDSMTKSYYDEDDDRFFIDDPNDDIFTPAWAMKPEPYFCNAVNLLVLEVYMEDTDTSSSLARKAHYYFHSDEILWDTSKAKLFFWNSDHGTIIPRKVPLLGFRMTTFVNSRVRDENILANFSVLLPHHFTCINKDNSPCVK